MAKPLDQRYSATTYLMMIPLGVLIIRFLSLVLPPLVLLALLAGGFIAYRKLSGVKTASNVASADEMAAALVAEEEEAKKKEAEQKQKQKQREQKRVKAKQSGSKPAKPATKASRKDDRDDNNDVDEEQLMTLLVSKRQASKSIAFSGRAAPVASAAAAPAPAKGGAPAPAPAPVAVAPPAKAAAAAAVAAPAAPAAVTGKQAKKKAGKGAAAHVSSVEWPATTPAHTASHTTEVSEDEEGWEKIPRDLLLA